MKAKLLHQETSVTPLTLGMIHRGFHHRLHTKYSKPHYFKNSFIAYKDLMVNWYGNWTNFCDIADSIISKIKKDGTLSKRNLDDTKKIGKKLKLLNNYILEQNIKLLSNKSLSGLFLRQYSLANDLCDYGQVAVHPDLRHYKLSTLLKNIIKNKSKLYGITRDVNDYFSVLITPPTHGLVQLEKIAILKFINRINLTKKLSSQWLGLPPLKIVSVLRGSYPAVYKELCSIQQSFCWSTFGHLGPPKPLVSYIKDVKNELKFKNKKILKQELLSSLIHLGNVKKLQRLYVKELKLSIQEKKLFYAARDFSENKVYRFDTLLHTWYVQNILLTEITKRINYSLSQLRFMSSEEVVGLLLGRIKVSKKNINARRNYCVTLIKGKRIVHLIGDDARAYIRHHVELEALSDDFKTLHGSVAFMGRVTGRAKIVNTPRDISKVKKGDIIISTQTNPDLLPAMKRAGAFVTDIGGITSHAAIVARELKKPCIIGTKIATNIFKDGDLIEVDAIKGDVRILKKYG